MFLPDFVSLYGPTLGPGIAQMFYSCSIVLSVISVAGGFLLGYEFRRAEDRFYKKHRFPVPSEMRSYLRGEIVHPEEPWRGFSIDEEETTWLGEISPGGTDNED